MAQQVADNRGITHRPLNDDRDDRQHEAASRSMASRRLSPQLIDTPPRRQAA